MNQTRKIFLLIVAVNLTFHSFFEWLELCLHRVIQVIAFLNVKFKEVFTWNIILFALLIALTEGRKALWLVRNLRKSKEKKALNEFAGMRNHFHVYL